MTAGAKALTRRGPGSTVTRPTTTTTTVQQTLPFTRGNGAAPLFGFLALLAGELLTLITKRRQVRS